MILINSKFDNFRCFKDYKIEYGKEVTVFIGKNGTGKSSVLSAIKRGLSFIFAKPKDYAKNFSISNNSTVKSYSKIEANFDQINRVYNYPINNEFVADYNGRLFEWSLIKKHMNGGLSKKPYSIFLNHILEEYNNNLGIDLPVLCVISDSFPHSSKNTGTKAKKIISQDVIPRDFGYYAWDDRTSCIDLWLLRFLKISDFEKDLYSDIEKIDEQIEFNYSLISNSDSDDNHKVEDWQRKIEMLQERRQYLTNDNRRILFAQERQYIEEKLLCFTRSLNDKFNFINKEFELYRISVTRQTRQKSSLEFFFKDGRAIIFDSLPMGYKRIFSIVLDIAYRSYILNENKESKGVVLIDEIELHLHPSLQQEILQRLKTTFPNLQFIVTTHSPLVISNFRVNDYNKIISLEQIENKYRNSSVDNIYGVDYNVGLTEVMGTKLRQSRLQEIVDAIVIFEKYEQKEQAQKMREELVRLVGDNQHIEKEIQNRIAKNK